MTTTILGISAFFHDSAAALVQDGAIVAAAQEERFTRRKGDNRFPHNAIAFCLEEAKIDAAKLDYVAFYERPLLKFERLVETYAAFAPRGYRSFGDAMDLWAKEKLQLPHRIAEALGEEFTGKMCLAEHHMSHAASAFFPSPFGEAAILTLDAVGEWATSSIGVGRGNRIELTHEMRFPHSLGMLYSAFTHYIGFKVNSGEYKLMGLAPYGEPRYVDVILDNLVDLREDGSLWLDMEYFNYCHGFTMTSERFHSLFGGPPRKPESAISQKEMDLAASVQVVCDEAVLRAAREAHRLTGMPTLVMAGGVALNSVANGRLLREGPFADVWIQPAAGDAGGALGAALLIWHQLLEQPREVGGRDSQRGSLLGPAYDHSSIALYLDSVGANYESIDEEDDLLGRVASYLDQQMVVGWFWGRMEYGPRALGCRSILGDARSADMQQRMNQKIKFRESFRPFAPCVLREFASSVFEMESNQESPYMLFVSPVRDEWRLPLTEDCLRRMDDPDLQVRLGVRRSKVPAVTHVDYSARMQTVDEERHGRFYRLMRRFYQRTGCPVLVNTSFNVRGQPIVCTFEDAYRCFMTTELDCLVLENHVLLKECQPEGSVTEGPMVDIHHLRD